MSDGGKGKMVIPELLHVVGMEELENTPGRLECRPNKEIYPEWLANPDLVKKPNGKWRTCVDFTDLNKACPKDSFPLPRINKLVDSTVGHALLSFMDPYSRYNKIPMYEPY